MATAAVRTDWHIVGEAVTSCNCAWGCPCQFFALPTHRYCEAFPAFRIERGSYGETSLDGVAFAEIFHWDGAVHEGNGWRQLIVSDKATAAQRSAIEEMTAGRAGHPVFEIYSSMAPNTRETIVAPIEFEFDHDRRTARVRIPGIGESDVAPIRNSVTGAEHRARIDLPSGFEYRVAEVADAVHWKTTAGEHLSMEHEHSYAQFVRFDWNSDGTTG